MNPFKAPDSTVDPFYPSRFSSRPMFWFDLWALVWAIGFALLATCAGCTRTIGAQGPTVREGVSSASVVTLLRVRRAEPCATTYAGEPCRLADTWEPACSATAVKSITGTVLVTAAHCTPHALGTELRYYAPNGWGHSTALLVARDSVHDLAVLEPRDPRELVPLERARVPSEGERVLSVSSVYDASSFGTVVGALGQGYYETTQTIVFGWSGSPVLDAHGRVWAVVSKCPVETVPSGAQGASAGADRCVARHTYVAGLGAL